MVRPIGEDGLAPTCQGLIVTQVGLGSEDAGAHDASHADDTILPVRAEPDSPRRYTACQAAYSKRAPMRVQIVHRATEEVRSAVLFPRNMGNRGQNVLSVPETFTELTCVSERVKFVAYHPRISGNSVFHYRDDKELKEVVELGQRVTGLACLARAFEALMRVSAAVPREAEVLRGSVVLRTAVGIKRVILVALSEPIADRHRVTGKVGKRVEILSWPSEQDALCLYDRPGESGDVGQVTRAVVGHVRRFGGYPRLYGTGRAMGVIEDLLTGRHLRRG